jgi:cholesterol transport system auxiliary component
MSRRFSALSLLAALALGGCVSLLPQSKPVTLYELTPEVAPASGGAAQTAPINLRLVSTRFEQASAGDRMLTVRSGQAAYIAGARWVSPASTLFDESLSRAFAERTSSMRLLSHANAAASALTLDVEVESFRVNLDGPTPVAEVALRARMIRYPDRAIVLDRRIEASHKADAERVGEIVKAYDAALGEALSTLVDATNQAAAGR